MGFTSPTPRPRSRMTAQSKANIPAAKEAVLIPEPNGYAVQLVGSSGSTCFIENAEGHITYRSMAAAKKTVKKYNPALAPTLKPTLK